MLKKLIHNKVNLMSFSHETIEYDPEIIYSASNHAENGQSIILSTLRVTGEILAKYSNSRRTFGVAERVRFDKKKYLERLIFEPNEQCCRL